MKKKIFIALAIIIIVAIGVIFIIQNKKNDVGYKIDKVEQYNYYVYKNDSQYGVIDKEGNIVVEATYSNILIPNPDKEVFVCYKDEQIEIKNAKNEKELTEFENIEPIKLKNVASTLTYEKSVLKYEKEGLYGLIDFQGKIITQNIYSSIENLQPTEGKFLVSKQGKYGVIDLKGNVLVETEYDKIISDEYYTENDEYKKSGFIILNKTEDGYKYGYIDYTGKKILENEYSEIERISKEKDSNLYLIASLNGKYGVYKNSKKIIDHEYQEIIYDDDEILILKQNKKYGAANLNGKIIINVENESVETKGKYMYVVTDQDEKVYDKKGKKVDIDFNKSIYNTENEKYKISTLLNNSVTYYGITDQNGKQLVQEKYRYIEYVFGNYFIATNDEGNIGVINTEDKVVLELKYSSVQKIKDKNIIQAISQDTNTTEFYSSNMEKTISAQRPTINNQENYIIVTGDEQTTYLDKDGNIVKNPSNIKNISYPNEIGEYQKQQVTLETVYYIKK